MTMMAAKKLFSPSPPPQVGEMQTNVTTNVQIAEGGELSSGHETQRL